MTYGICRPQNADKSAKIRKMTVSLRTVHRRYIGISCKTFAISAFFTTQILTFWWWSTRLAPITITAVAGSHHFVSDIVSCAHSLNLAQFGLHAGALRSLKTHIRTCWLGFYPKFSRGFCVFAEINASKCGCRRHFLVPGSISRVSEPKIAILNSARKVCKITIQNIILEKFVPLSAPLSRNRPASTLLCVFLQANSGRSFWLRNVVLSLSSMALMGHTRTVRRVHCATHAQKSRVLRKISHLQ
jgi:hypothetical protein